MPDNASILVVDDEPSMQNYLRAVLEIDSHRVEVVGSGMEAISRLQRGLSPDLVLLDLLMPDMDGFDTLERIRNLRPGLKVVILSCESDVPKVVQAVRMGADDYITKPFRKERLDAVVSRYLKRQENTQENSAETIELSDDSAFVCASPEMRKIRIQAALVAKVDIPVLLLGASGTGKEVVAKLIHKLSPRAHRSFRKINCAAVPADLLESELFGYEAGAFTGANKPKPGLFELCNNGTIFLDEIGEMPPPMQAKLLHVLQDGQFSRLGSRSMVQVDVRVLAATNVDIQEAIASKKFREDLYYRLNGFSLTLPLLRERKPEIQYLLQHFMNRMSERYGRAPLPISPKLLRACEAYHWPGNLRELENFIKRYLVLGDEDAAIAALNLHNEIECNHVQFTTPSPKARPIQGPANVDVGGGLKSLVRSVKDDTEAEAISEVLKQTNWNRTKAAPLLKISYKALLYKIRQYDLKPPERNKGSMGAA
jgi:two-component system response regulator AtoC